MTAERLCNRVSETACVVRTLVYWFYTLTLEELRNLIGYYRIQVLGDDPETTCMHITRLEDVEGILIGDILENCLNNVMKLGMQPISLERQVGVEKEVGNAMQLARGSG